MNEKVCFLTEDPEEFSDGVWSLHYGPEPDLNVWYTSVTEQKCEEIKVQTTAWND